MLKGGDVTGRDGSLVRVGAPFAGRAELSVGSGVSTVCGAGEALRDSRGASTVERGQGVGDPIWEAYNGLSRVREADSKG
jgi:hypothetical protein